MRTHFEPEEAEEFEAAKDLLIRRCQTWAAGREPAADEMLLAAALDSRHRSRDGRLGFWDPGQVRRLLLEWIPHYVVAPPDVTAATESLRTLLRYMDAAGLLDPRGAALPELERAVTEAAAEYPAAVADELRWGVAKYWAQKAFDAGVDLTDPKALDRFQRDVDAGRVPYDQDTLDKLFVARMTGAGPDEERAFSQPPVALPPASELAEAAARSQVVRQLTALAEWAGAEGRPLTGTGALRLADARELAGLLGTGEQDLKVRSSTEMRRLNLLFSWAKSTRIVRVSKGRLYRVAKAAPLLRDPERLWARAFEAFFELGDAIGPPVSGWSGPPILPLVFDEVLTDVLNSAYGLPEPLPVARLQETVWLACQSDFLLSAMVEDIRREQVDRDLGRALDVLAELGAVELSHGLADELYSLDLAGPDEPGGLDEDLQPLPPEARARLRARLAEPGLLVRLTPLGLRATRERMLADGRDVPLVGELAGAPPAGLLGVLAEHYTAETGALELEGWLAAHGGSIDPLLDAIRACPFRARASAMLNVLVHAHPDGTRLLRDLRGDRELGPLAVTALTEAGDLAPHDLTPGEQLMLMAEGLLTLLELAGPEEAQAQIRKMAGKDAAEVVEAVANSGHPAEECLAEFRALVAEPMRAGRHRLRLVGRPAPGSRGRPDGRGKKRRR